ncbi:hypothetical protein C0J52_03457 [Blattella germanica]|nr:hypothetical protein C0J52_03457 [Blattella germanica]
MILSRISNSGDMNLADWKLFVFIFCTLNPKCVFGFPNSLLISCEYNTLNSFANCSKRGLEQVPSGLEGYKNICLAFNQLRTIGGNDFNEARDVVKLNLKNNIIETVAVNAFSNLKDLKVLDLSDNRLSHLFDNQFENNEELNYLNLKGNSIVFQSSTIVSNSLEFLDLSYCEIANINFNSIMNLPNLRVLLLHKNPISNLYNVQVLQEMHRLHFLSMDPCQLGDFNGFTMYLNSLKIYHPEVRICRDEDVNGKQAPLEDELENQFFIESDENSPETYLKYLYYFHTGKANVICFIFFFVIMSLFISCLIYVLIRRISRNSATRKPTNTHSPPPTQTNLTTEETMPLYKSMLKFLLFGVHQDQKKDPVNESNTTEVQVENTQEIIKQADNKKY